MRINLSINDRPICSIAVWADRYPQIASGLETVLPITTVAQHGKIVGDLLYLSVPIVLPLENPMPLQEICRERRRQTGSVAGAVCFYGPRQQICIYYGDDVADEPFELSWIGEVDVGLSALQLAAMDCWVRPGELASLEVG